METLFISVIGLLFGGISSLTAVGASGFFLLPIFLDLLHLAGGTSAALAETANILTSIPCLLVEKQYGTLSYSTAMRCCILALPGTFVGTALSSVPNFTSLLWLLTMLTGIILFGTGWLTFALKRGPNSSAAEVLPFWKEAGIHFLIGLLCAATGVGGTLFYIAWLFKRTQLSLNSAIPTAQLIVLLLSSFSVIEHLGHGVSLTLQEILGLFTTAISAWYGAKIAHFYSSGLLRMLYLTASSLTGLLLVAKSIMPLL